MHLKSTNNRNDSYIHVPYAGADLREDPAPPHSFDGEFIKYIIFKYMPLSLYTMKKLNMWGRSHNIEYYNTNIIKRNKIPSSPLLKNSVSGTGMHIYTFKYID